MTMFENMIPFDLAQRRKYPLGYMRVRNWLLERVMLRSMKKADQVICHSEFAEKVIENNAPGLSSKIVVIPHGIGLRFRSDRALRPEWLPAERYILYVSTIDVYKAQVEVVRAYALLKQRRPSLEKLVLVGPERPHYAQKVRDEIARLALQPDVFLTGPVSHDQLPSLYQNALINVFASECESCPNIMLEALASGRPLLASNRPPMPEFAGDAAIYFDPSNPQELAEKLRSIIDDPVRLAELSAKATERSQLYDWAKLARTTWTVLDELVSAPCCGSKLSTIVDRLCSLSVNAINRILVTAELNSDASTDTNRNPDPGRDGDAGPQNVSAASESASRRPTARFGIAA